MQPPMSHFQRLAYAASQGATWGALLASIAVHNLMAFTALCLLTVALHACCLLWNDVLKLEAWNDELDLRLARLDLIISDLEDNPVQAEEED